ncbi:hypothetical protein [Spirosoma rhododendri]|uniref:hypothetical protein n=1 Tax=Spirosoma rhododendri TaxID=2728024 RepID=UPI002FCD884A
MNPTTRLFAFLFICLTGFFPAFAQPVDSLTPGQARADIAFLKRKLDLLHPGMGFYTPARAWNNSMTRYSTGLRLLCRT